MAKTVKPTKKQLSKLKDDCYYWVEVIYEDNYGKGIELAFFDGDELFPFYDNESYLTKKTTHTRYIKKVYTKPVKFKG